MPPAPRPLAQGRSEGRTAWHVYLANLIKQRAPRNFTVLSEVPLGVQPPRIDLLLLRRVPGRRGAPGARVLRGLWPLITHTALLEYKSPSESVRKGDLSKLVSYAMLLASRQFDDDAFTIGGLLVGWVLPSITPAVHAELRRLGVTLEPGGHGYHRLTGWSLTLIIVVLDEVSEVEHDALLGVFGHGSVASGEAQRWWRQQTGVIMGKVDRLAGFEAMKAKFLASLSERERLAGLDPATVVANLAPEQRIAGLDPKTLMAQFAPEQRLAGLDPEQRLAGLDPEQRLAGLDPEQRLAGLPLEEVGAALGPSALLTLPIEALRALPSSYIATLSADLRDRIAARLAAASAPTPRKQTVKKTGQRQRVVKK